MTRNQATGIVAIMSVATLRLAVAVAAEPVRPVGPPPDEPSPIRELYVPLKDFDALMEGQTDRVLLPRAEYEALVEQTRQPETAAPAPLAYAVVSADYRATVEGRRARIEGRIVLDLLRDELTAVRLDLAGVGLRVATLDGEPAAIGRDGKDAPLKLFVAGRGRHRLTLQMVTPLTTTAAQQELHFRLPESPAGSLRLTVPGDVEMKSGASVVRRVVEDRAAGSIGATHFTLLPRAGTYDLTMTLNSHTRRAQRAVLASSVVVDEVTETYERLHATVTLDVLHRAVDAFEFVVPDDFEVTGVSTPDLARWMIETDSAGRSILRVQLRQEATGRVTLGVGAVKTSPTLSGWAMPRLTPLDVVGQTAVVGLLVDERLRATSIASSRLVPIDTEVLRSALPASVFESDPGAPPIRPVAAWYAPEGATYAATADFTRPEATLAVTTNVLLELTESRQVAHGGFSITPQYDKVFAVDFELPAEWRVEQVTQQDGRPLKFERPEPTRVHVRLDRGIAPGERYRMLFEAVAMPAGWLGPWDTQQVDFPVFKLRSATSDVGALAIQVERDLTLRPETVEQLTPLDEAMRAEYLAGIRTDLAYRYAAQPYRLTLGVERKKPRMTARTFSFATVETDGLKMRYELAFSIEEARARELRFLLPEHTPEALRVDGLDSLAVKEYVGCDVVDGMRPWVVRLDQPRQGMVRLGVALSQSLDVEKRGEVDVPIIRAEGVAWQSGLIAVEGNEELDIRLQPGPDTRRVDVGEIEAARHATSRRLLGAFGFVGREGKLAIGVARHPAYGLYSTIVENGSLRTRLSAGGVAETLAVYRLRTKSMYLEVTLPKGAELWSAALDNTPVKPQSDAERLLISLPTGDDTTIHELRLFYRQKLPRLSMLSAVKTPGPALWTRSDPRAEAVAVPVADLDWTVALPAGYRVVGSSGTVTCDLTQPDPLLGFGRAARGSAAVFAPGPLLLSGRRAKPRTVAGGEAPAASSDDLVRSAEPLDVWAEGGLEGGEPTVDAEMRGDMSAPGGDMSDMETDFGSMRQERAKAAAPFAVPENRERQAGEAFEPAVTTAETALPEPPPPPTSPPMDASAVAVPSRRETLPSQTEPSAPDERRSLEPSASVQRRRLDGVRSLRINFEDDPSCSASTIRLTSLGVDPELELTLAEDRLFTGLGLLAAIAVVLSGLVIRRRRASFKAVFVVTIIVVGGLFPLIPGLESIGDVAGAAIAAALALVPLYLVIGFVRRVRRGVSVLCPPLRDARGDGKTQASTIGTAVLLLITVSTPLANDATAADPESTLETAGLTVQVVPPPGPVEIPDDAILVPYDSEQAQGPSPADRLLIPYARYVELWNAAHPDEKLTNESPPVAYAPAGVAYRTTLLEEDGLRVEGVMEIDVYVDAPIVMPLSLGGCVLTGATLDGRPARISMTRAPIEMPAEKPAEQMQQQATPQPPSVQLAVLHIEGKGRHELEFTARIRLQRQGGWRLARAVLPSSAAARMTLTVPDAETDVRLGHVADQRRYETSEPKEAIETTLAPSGDFEVQWRPKVAEGQVDHTLTATSQAVFDVRENGLRAVWRIRLQFSHGRRDSFEIRVPADYLVEAIEGANVRGWEIKSLPGDAASDAMAGTNRRRQKIEIELLKAAEQEETLTVRLLKTGAVGSPPLAAFDAPIVSVAGAALHRGELGIRRSPLLEVHTTATSGVARTDMAADVATRIAGGSVSNENPFEVRPLQAFRFTAEPFRVALSATPIRGRVGAAIQNILKISEFERSLDTRLQLAIDARPVYQVELFLPEGLTLETVTAPGQYDWAETDRDGRRLLTIYSTTGLEGRVSILLEGTLPAADALDPMPLPAIEMLGVDRQTTDFAVQVDPAYDVKAVGLDRCDTRLLDQLDWLNAENRRQTRLALYSGGADYAGRLEISLRKADVRCETITNVQVTDRAVEETLVLNYTINKAGVRTLAFLLPAWMADSRIEAPVVQQKTIVSTGAGEQAPLRVTIDLQEEQMNEYRVLIRNDRLLVPGQPYEAPIPTIETGEAQRQYVVLENAGGRDEIIVDDKQLRGLELLNRRRPEWAKLAAILGERMTAAYVVEGPDPPRLVFHSLQRTSLEMAGAMIGLAETQLVLDENGDYRAEQIYFIDNKTEQFLDVELPEGARLWTAQLFSTLEWEQKKQGAAAAGEPVKPTVVPGAADDRQVRIPLIKTEVGDLDYVIRLQYGGTIPSLSSFTTVDFPLLRVREIPVEQSTVRLCLPESYAFYNFDGTMRLADRAAVSQAVQSYNLKQNEKIDRAMRSRNPYERERAARSRGTVQMLVEGADSMASEVEGRTPPTADYRQQDVPDSPSGLSRELDNRDQLSSFYQQQRNDRAKNVVNETGRNWDTAEIDSQSRALGKQTARFNAGWLEENKLLNAADSKNREKKPQQGAQGPSPKDQTQPTPSLRLKSADRASQVQLEDYNLNKGGRIAKESFFGEIVDQQRMALQPQQQMGRQPALNAPAGEELQRSQGQPGGYGGGGGYSGGGGYGNEYGGSGPMGGIGGQAPNPTGAPGVIYDDDGDPNSQAGLATHGGFPADQDRPMSQSAFGLAVPQSGGYDATAQPVATGMTSLDVELPERGVVYEFTAPQGGGEVSATVVATSLLDRLMRLGMILGGAAACLAAVAAARYGCFTWMRKRNFGFVCLALAVVLCCLFPVLALLLAATGAYVLIGHYSTRQLTSTPQAE